MQAKILTIHTNVCAVISHANTNMKHNKILMHVKREKNSVYAGLHEAVYKGVYMQSIKVCIKSGKFTKIWWYYP
jgi:hypothetical protein